MRPPARWPWDGLALREPHLLTSVSTGRGFGRELCASSAPCLSFSHAAATLVAAPMIPIPLPVSDLTRRDFLRRAAGLPLLGALLPGCAHQLGPPGGADNPQLLFTSQGRTGIMDLQGRGLRYFDFKVEGQATWQPGGVLPRSRRLLFLSMEPRRDGPGRPFEEYYTQTPTHIWAHDLVSGSLTEVANRDRMAVFYTPALVLGENRLLVQVVRNKVGQVFSMNLDGSDAREFTRAGEGLPYGLSASPDGRRVAFHLASPQGYQVWTSDADGGNRVRIAAHPDHLYFGTSWSPDGQWILYHDCHFRGDPGHDWSDVCIGRADGTQHQVLTEGQGQWFAATYGMPGNRGGGSNMAAWMPDGRILFSQRLPGSRVPWEYQAGRPDTDHFNREFRPAQAKGGTRIVALDPKSGRTESLTQSDPPVWDFRASPSPDGRHIVFCRAETGGLPAIHVMRSDGSGVRLLTRGIEEKGVDHPRWL